MADFDATTAAKIRAMRNVGNLVGLVQTAYTTIVALADMRAPYGRVEASGTDPADIIIHDALTSAYTGSELTELFAMSGALEDTVVGWDLTYAEVIDFTVD